MIIKTFITSSFIQNKLLFLTPLRPFRVVPISFFPIDEQTFLDSKKLPLYVQLSNVSNLFKLNPYFTNL